VRIVAAELSHETNRFSAVPTDLAAFQRSGIHRGEEMIPVLQNTATPIAGFLDSAREHDFELIPILAVWATPSGMVTEEALETLLAELLREIANAGRIDGILIGLHGAMVAEHQSDADGYILRSIREQVGKRVPIVATLDLHANISQTMVDNADLLIGFDTYPHVDQRERAREAGTAIVKIANKEMTPTPYLVKPPMMPTSQNMATDVDPMRSIIERAIRIEDAPEVINVTVAGGFPPADVEEGGFSVIVTTDEDLALARTLAMDLANFAWKQRDGFLGGVSTWDEASAALRAIEAGPLVLVDIGDNPWTGGPGDSAELLRFLLQQNASSAAVALIKDPESVERCIEAGPGAMVEVTLGGKIDGLHGASVEVTGYIQTISDGWYVNAGPMHAGVGVNLGRSVVLNCNGVQVLVTEHAETPIDLNIFRRHGIEPTAMQVIGLKGKGHFRASFEPIAERVLLVEGPGITGAELSRLTFEHVRRPIWPLDPDTVFERSELSVDGESD
jgi:microcystin degradation protein MlrC